MHAKARHVFSVAWKGVATPKPKLGYARVSILGTDSKPVVYQTQRAPVTLNMAGKTGTIDFDGKTPEGVRGKLTATCGDVESL